MERDPVGAVLTLCAACAFIIVLTALVVMWS